MQNNSLFKSENSFNVLYTTDVLKTHDFFKALGCQINQLESDKVVVTLGTFSLHFILNTAEPFEAYQYIAIADKYGQGNIFYLETNNIVQAKEVIEQAGGIIKADTFENHWGYLELLFEDPNGYKFALYQEK